MAAASETSSTSLVPVSTTTSSKPTEKISNPKARKHESKHSPTVKCFQAIPRVCENKVTKRLFHFVVIFNGDFLFAIAVTARGHCKKSLRILAANVCVVFFLRKDCCFESWKRQEKTAATDAR